MSLDFEWPWLAVLLPLPYLLRWLLPALPASGQAALKAPFPGDFALSDGAGAPARSGARILVWLAALAWLCLVLAVMRPLWRGEPLALPSIGRDLLLAVDLSDSMQERDFVLGVRRVNRLQAAQQLGGDFIARRTGDRVGLILFGTRAYLQSPLTFDRDTVRDFLGEARIGLAGPKTAIGDAIGLAIKHLRQRQVTERVLILLTDGSNTAGEVDPLEAAELAAREGVRIHTMGIGRDPSGFFGRRASPLDEKTLGAISSKSRGRYFRARDTRELEQIYQELDRLEPTSDEPLLFRPQTALYYWPLAAAVLLSALIVLLRNTGGRYGIAR